VLTGGRVGAVVLTVAAAIVLTACSGKNAGNAIQPGVGDSSGASSSASSSGAESSAPVTTAPTTTTPPPPAPAAKVTITPAASVDGAPVSPVVPVKVAVAGGKLTSVRMTNAAGKVITGVESTDKKGWQSSEVLGYGKTYTIAATAVNADGKPVAKKSVFSTLTPDNMTMPYLQVLGGTALVNGATYGVAIVPVIHFDESIADKAAAMKALTVTTTPHVNGAWYWVDDSNVHFRPATYWPSGTKVTIRANVYGVEVGPGLYGQSDVTSSFTIGRKQVTEAFDSSPQVDKVNVYDAAGKLIKQMNTSMGEHSGETVNGQYINFYTPGGTYTVLDHENPAIMSSASYGLPANAPGGYAPEAIPYSTKISIDGIYLHELDNTVWAQNSGEDVSHGCLNLSQDNAIWFFDHSMVGDPVVIHPTPGAPALQIWEGGDWSVPWSTWIKGGI
jgi:lipoprotein-anchoring transpeptidase ErfK/SrfK